MPLTLGMPFQLMGMIMISLIAWSQVGFEMDGIRLLFIGTNYFCWLLLLPWINGCVFEWNSHANKIISNLLRLLQILAVHLLFSNLLFYLLRFGILDYRLLPTTNEVSEYLLSSVISRIIDLTLFVGLLTWIRQSNLLNERKVEVSMKETELQRSKLQSLKNQLNPHFLFNSMHNIASLIGHDDDMAQRLTIRVSNLLRKIMVINELEEHLLVEEWKFLQDYLEIESERFQDRLKLEVSFDQAVSNQVVPTLILQPLVENSFKHGITHAINPTTLLIIVRREEDGICIKVVNEIFPNKPNNHKNGVGLANLKERLRTYYKGYAYLKTEVSNNQFIATIKLPRA